MLLVIVAGHMIYRLVRWRALSVRLAALAVTLWLAQPLSWCPSVSYRWFCHPVAYQGILDCLLENTPRLSSPWQACWCFVSDFGLVFGRRSHWPFSRKFSIVEYRVLCLMLFLVLGRPMSRLLYWVCWQARRGLSFWLARSPDLRALKYGIQDEPFSFVYRCKNAFDRSGYYLICLTCWRHLPWLANVLMNLARCWSRFIPFLT